MSQERVVIFIDGSNLYHALSRQCGRTDVDFFKLSQALCGDRKLIRTYYYNARVRREDGEERYQAQQKFFDRLTHVPYLELRLGRLEKRGEAVVEKGIDVKVATDMLWQAHNGVYDTAILISGDADYVPAVEAVKNIGRHVELATLKTGRSQDLMRVVDRVVSLDEVIQDCWL